MICGSRRESDIRLLAASGVDAIGLITEARQEVLCNLSREEARKLVRDVPPMVSTVLILTEERVEEIRRLVDYVKPDTVQLHGFNTPEHVRLLKEKLPVKIIKTLHMQGNRMLESADPLQCGQEYLDSGADALLVDNCQGDKVGSTGQTVNFSTVRQLRDTLYPSPLILAGGLHPGNVSEAVQQVQPFGVDVFTGVNSGGNLDPYKVKDFVKAIRCFQEEGGNYNG